MSWDPNWSVEVWLEGLGLGAYAENFLDNGYNLQELCANLKEEDLDAIEVEDEKHRELLFAQSQVLREEAVARFKSKSSVGSAGSTDHSGSMGSHGSFPAYSEPWENLEREPKHLYSDVWVGEAEPQHGPVAQLQNGQGFAELFDDPKRRLDKQKGNTFPPVPPPKAPRKKKVWPPGPTSPQPLPPPPAHPLPPAPQSAGGLTKLQLKLKVLEELQKDRIILSEAPYCKEDGTLDEEKIAELSHSYSERFQLEPPQVLETVINICKTSSTPAEMKKLSWDEADTGAHQPGPRNVLLSSSNLYEEPIDKTDDILALPSHPKETSPPHKKSFTLPPSLEEGIYQEPVDTLLGVKPSTSPQQIGGPKKQSSDPRLQKPKSRSHEGSPDEKHRSSPHTSPHSSPRVSPSLSPRASPIPSPLTSPKHTQKKFGFFKRKEKKAARSQSIKELDLRKTKAGQAVLYPVKDKNSHLWKKKHSSTEDLLHAANSKQSSTATRELQEAKASLTFLPPSVSLPNGGGSVPPPLPPYRRTISMSSSSSSETSPPASKKFGLLRLSKRWGSPQVNRKANRGHTESESHKRKKRDFRKSRAASDLELHKVGADSDTEQEHQLLRSSQSHEELRNIRVSHDNTPAPEKAKKETKKGGFFKLLKKKRNVSKKGGEEGGGGGGGGGGKEGGGEEGEGGGGEEEDERSLGSAEVEVTDSRFVLSSSISMPEIAYAAIRRGTDTSMRSTTGYEYVTNSPINPEVTVQADRSKTQPHKSSLRHGRSPIASPISPEMSPLMQRRVTQSGQSHSGDHLIPIQSGYADEEDGERERGGTGKWQAQSSSHTLLQSTQSNESGIFSSNSRIDYPSESSETTSIGSQTSKEVVGSVDSRGSVFGSYTSESSMTFPPTTAPRASSGSTGSVSRKGPPPPPKPKFLEKGLPRSRVKPSRPSTDAKTERGSKDEGRGRGGSGAGEGVTPPVKPPRLQRGSVKKAEGEGGGGGGESGGDGGGGGGGGSVGGGEEKAREDRKPPPKPARRHRTMKPEKTDQQVVQETKSQTMPPRTTTSENSASAKKEEQIDRSPTSPTSSGGRGRVTPRRHGPVPKPRPNRSRPTSAEEAPPPSLEASISKKLSEEGIDLTISPYSNVWGEGAVPHALISRYAMELEHPEDIIALTMDEIRGRELKKLTRDYVPIKRVDSMRHTELAKESLESFLISVGLPMYLTKLREKGYASIPHLLELTDAKLQSFSFPSSHRKLLLENVHKL